MKIKTNTNKPVKMDVNTGGRIDMSIVSGGGGALIPTYKGPYEVTPSDEIQMLETNGRKMVDDVIVNPSGGGGTPVINPLPVTANGTYTAPSGVDGYSPVTVAVQNSYTPTDEGKVVSNGALVSQTADSVTANNTYDTTLINSLTVNVPQGLIIPDGFLYYNGYLLPELPVYSGYNYAFIRKNDQNDTFDCALGYAQWYSASNATLDNWRLTFAGQASHPAQQYSIPQDGTATDWGDPTQSTNVYGTNSARKVIWTSHDIVITAGTNILLRQGFAISSSGPIMPT